MVALASGNRGCGRGEGGVVAQALEGERVAAGGARERGKDEIRLGCPGFHFLYRNFTVIPLI
jgi:hypothetical protein